MPPPTPRTRLPQSLADPALVDVKVIVLTTFELDWYVFEALRGGASGFVLKDADPSELLPAIRVAADGASLLSPSVTRRVIEQFSARSAPTTTAHPKIRRLTEREHEIVAWVSTGHSNDVIARSWWSSRPLSVRT